MFCDWGTNREDDSYSGRGSVDVERLKHLEQGPGRLRRRIAQDHHVEEIFADAAKHSGKSGPQQLKEPRLEVVSHVSNNFAEYWVTRLSSQSRQFPKISSSYL